MTYVESDPEVQRVRYEIRRFRQHLITYIAVVGVLFLINVLSGGFWYGHWWFLWIALIWGVFLALQAAHLFGDHLGHEWEDRMVDHVLANRRRQAAAAAPRSSYTPPQPPRPASAAAASPQPGSTPPAWEPTRADVRQEPIITPPPVSTSNGIQEPTAIEPPGSVPEEASESENGPPRPPDG